MAYVITDRENCKRFGRPPKPAIGRPCMPPPSMRSPIPTMPINLFRAWISRCIPIKGAYGVNSNRGRLPITFVTKPSCSMSCAPGMCPMTGKRASRMPPTTSPKLRQDAVWRRSEQRSQRAAAGCPAHQRQSAGHSRGRPDRRRRGGVRGVHRCLLDRRPQLFPGPAPRCSPI